MQRPKRRYQPRTYWRFLLNCGAWMGLTLGLEPTSRGCTWSTWWTVFREVWRVLRKGGTLWLNLGDSYATGGGTSARRKPSSRR